MARRRRNYAFVRSVPTFGSAPQDMPDWNAMQAAGWDVPLIDYRDPRLATVAAALKQQGREFGIWGAPGDMDAETFGRQMAGVSQRYNPSVLVPDLEFESKGYEGSPGWAYNQQLARLWQQLMPNQNTAITVMPNQRDFNYEAWQGIADEWLPQAYGADPMKHIFDPAQIRQTLIDRGIDPSMIAPVLGPGHKPGYAGPSALWTIDDFIGRDLPGAYRGDGRELASAGAPPPAQGPRTKPGEWSNVDTFERVPDAQNPRAVAYAQGRLAQLRNLGIDVPAGADPTAMWREASKTIGATARERGYANPREFLRTGSRPVSKRPSPKKPGKPVRRPGVKER
jgi:hypothetical protein